MLKSIIGKILNIIGQGLANYWNHMKSPQVHSKSCMWYCTVTNPLLTIIFTCICLFLCDVMSRNQYSIDTSFIISHLFISQSKRKIKDERVHYGAVGILQLKGQICGSMLISFTMRKTRSILPPLIHYSMFELRMWSAFFE